MRYLVFMAVGLLFGCVSRASEPPIKRSLEETIFDAAWQSADDWTGSIDEKARNYRFVYRQDAYSPAPDDLLASFGNVSGLDGEYRWVIPPGKELVCGATPIAVIAFPSQPERLAVFNDVALVGFTQIRIIFRVHDERVPVKMYRHGSEVDVAKWGTGLVPMAIEFVDGSDTRLLQLFLESIDRKN